MLSITNILARVHTIQDGDEIYLEMTSVFLISYSDACRTKLLLHQIFIFLGVN